MAARLSRGTPWPDGGIAELGDTLFICTEDDPADTIVPRLIGAGADRERTQLLRTAKIIETTGKKTEVAFDLSNVGLIQEALERMPDCKLVVIDPIGSYLGGRINAHRDNEVRSVLAPLAMLAAERNVAIVLVCHTRKAAAAFADDATLGSRAFVGLARSVLHLFVDEEDRERKLLLPGKNNLSQAAPGLAYRIVGDPPHLEWEEDPIDDMHADDALAPTSANDRRHGPKPESRDAAVLWLTNLLQDGPKPVTEIKEQAEAEGSRGERFGAQEVLGIAPRKGSFTGGWTWELADRQVGQGDSARWPRIEGPGRLHENLPKTDENARITLEGGQVPNNSANFEEDVDKNGTSSEALFPDSRGLPD